MSDVYGSFNSHPLTLADPKPQYEVSQSGEQKKSGCCAKESKKKEKGDKEVVSQEGNNEETLRRITFPDDRPEAPKQEGDAKEHTSYNQPYNRNVYANVYNKQPQSYKPTPQERYGNKPQETYQPTVAYQAKIDVIPVRQHDRYGFPPGGYNRGQHSIAPSERSGVAPSQHDPVPRIDWVFGRKPVTPDGRIREVRIQAQCEEILRIEREKTAHQKERLRQILERKSDPYENRETSKQALRSQIRRQRSTCPCRSVSERPFCRCKGEPSVRSNQLAAMNICEPTTCQSKKMKEQQYLYKNIGPPGSRPMYPSPQISVVDGNSEEDPFKTFDRSHSQMEEAAGQQGQTASAASASADRSLSKEEKSDLTFRRAMPHHKCAIWTACPKCARNMWTDVEIKKSGCTWFCLTVTLCLTAPCVCPTSYCHCVKRHQLKCSLCGYVLTKSEAKKLMKEFKKQRKADAEQKKQTLEKAKKNQDAKMERKAGASYAGGSHNSSIRTYNAKTAPT